MSLALNNLKRVDVPLSKETETETEKAVEHEGDGDNNCIWRTWNGLQRLWHETGGIGNQERSYTIQTTTWLRSTRIPRRVLVN